MADMLESRGMRVVVVGRTCGERETEVDEKDAELEGEDERPESEEMELDRACEERDANSVDRGGAIESLVWLEKVGEGLSNVIVARVVGIIGISILKALVG
jgi:hypothetical protein